MDERWPGGMNKISGMPNLNAANEQAVERRREERKTQRLLGYSVDWKRERERAFRCVFDENNRE